MEILFAVSDFGKIKHAEVTLSDFTLFVGDNNSGKTFMMQLMYGVLKELQGVNRPVIDGIEEEGDRFIYAAEWFDHMETQVNEYLSKNKEKIIRRIFHKDIVIGELSIRLVNRDERYICEIKNQEFEEIGGEDDEIVVMISGILAELYVMDRDGDRRKKAQMSFYYQPNKNDLKGMLATRIWSMILSMGSMMNADSLFLPASRTGLQLLSKYFFAERDRKAISEIGTFDVEEEEANTDVTENELGLTMPVYDFLQFLLRYNQRSKMTSENRDLIEFIEQHLIDGQIKYLGDEIYYHPDALTEDKEDIPLYLASSLVNEATPIIKALSGIRNYKYIFYDEVETCLHPLKQGEMARLIMRLVNSRRRVIVSTHSDTMAGKLNNLLLLSFSQDSEETRKKKLTELGLKKEDLLSDANVHVYQFVNQADGSSLVEELEFHTMPFVGYDFKLFTQNLDDLYRETDIILKK